MVLRPSFLRPKAAGSETPAFVQKGYTRLWGLTTQASGTITGTASADTGKYAVRWWDNTVSVYGSGDTFAKAALGNQRAFEVFPVSQPETSLLLHFDGPNGSTTFTDSSPNGLTVTANGDAEISTAQSKFGGASGYFDGTGDYLSVPSNAAFDFGTGDFTLEAWVRMPDPGTQGVIASGGDGFPTGWAFYAGGSSGTAASFACNDGDGWSGIAGGTLSADTWHHIAAVRHGGVVNLYLDGQSVASTSDYDGPLNSSAFDVEVARDDTTYINAYIDDLRIVKGAALYTSNFTPPAAPLTVVSPSVPAEYPPTLLLHFDGANGSTTFTDSSPNNFTVTANGGAEISTTQSKFGGAGGDFDGVNSALTVSDTSVGDFGTGDFTIEAWIYPRSLSGSEQTLAAKWQSGGYAWLWNFKNNEIYLVSGASGFYVAITGAWASNANAWNHVALTRQAGTLRIFADGVLLATQANTDDWQTNYGMTIANLADSGGLQYFDGFVDDFRVIQGVAAYTANFTPPTAPLSGVPTSVEPSGQFDGFDVSGNSLTSLRAEDVSLSSAAGYYTYSYPYGYVYVPGTTEDGDLSDNDLSAEALDQFYTDLDAGTGDLFVQGNPGIAGDDPTIATGKGYTVFGSVPPSTSLLLHFDGANGDTTTTDSSPNALTSTFLGNAEISTTQSKWGGSSLYIPDNGDSVQFPFDAPFDFGTGDFTIEFWWYPVALGRDVWLTGGNWFDDCGLMNSALLLTFFQETGISRLNAQRMCVGDFLTANYTPTLNQWVYLAFTRQAGTVRVFVDGAELAAGSDNLSANASPSGWSIGIDANPYKIPYGVWAEYYIDELRIVKGAALYTANFTPPTGPLTVYP